MSLLENTLIILLLMILSAFFSISEICEGAYAPAFSELFSNIVVTGNAATLGSIASFMLVTAAFIRFADLISKRIAPPMLLCLKLLQPLIWVFNTIAMRLINLFGLPAALTKAGAKAGFKFEVIDIDNHKIDQLLVTRVPK